MTEDDGPSANRRRLLRTLAASVAAPAIAGCSGGGGGDGEDGGDGSDGGDGGDGGDGSDGTGSDGSDGMDGDGSDGTDSGDGTDGDGSDGSDGDGSDGTDGDGGDSTPTDEETTGPGTTESGPGGDSAFVGTMRTQDRQTSAWDQFESLTVDFQRLRLIREEGDPVDLQVGTEVDLVALEPGEDQTYIPETAIPAGIYTTAELYMPIQSATLNDGSEPSAPLPELNPFAIELEAFDDYMEVESGTTVDWTATINLVERYSGDGWRLAAGWSAGYS